MMFRAFSKAIAAAKAVRLRSKDVILMPKRTCATEKWYYRTSKPQSDIPFRHKLAAEFVGTLMWYNILWHLWYDYPRLLGHHPVVNPLEWTDEELGIPKEDYA